MICAALNESDKAYLCNILEISRTPAFRGIKGITNNEVVCAAGFDAWTPNSCQTHLWIRSPGDLTRKFVTEVFKYLFVTCDLGLVIGCTPCNNVAALRFNKKLGWKEIARIKDGYALGTDMAIQEIRREDCRWISQEDRKCQKDQPHQPQIIPPQQMLRGNNLRH